MPALPTLPAFHVKTAAEGAAEVAQINANTAPGWTSYTPTFTSAGGATTLGTGGTLTGSYRRPANADLAHIRGRLVFGTAPTFGSSFWYVSLPPACLPAAAGLYMVGRCFMREVGIADFGGICMTENASGNKLFFAANGADVTPSFPFVWAAGDWFSWDIEYQPQ